MIYVSDFMEDKKIQKLAKEAGCGLEPIYFGIGDSLDTREESLAKFKDWYPLWQELPLSVHGPFLDLNPVSYDALVREASWKRYEQTLDAAEHLEAKKVIFHSCFDPLTHYPQGWAERMSEFWNTFLEAHPTKLEVCMENVYDKDPHAMLEVYEAVSKTHPNFGLCFDIGHASAYTEVPVAEWLEILAEGISHFHLHDNDGTRDAHLAIGAADLFTPEVWTLVTRIAAHADVTIENFTLEQLNTSLEQLSIHVGKKVYSSNNII